MSDNIKVVVKVRPLISREIEEKLSYQWRVKNNSLYQIDHNGKEYGQTFTFDKVYDENTKTSDVYNDIAKPIVEAATAGFNGTIFAYGQTSSGKTYTMSGTEESPGIIQMAVLNLFQLIKTIPDRDFLVRVSYLEIYNETVKDLFNVEKEHIKIHESLNGIKVDVTEKVTPSPEDVLEAMKMGEVNRQTGATNMNEKSSRSHSIFQITIESREHVEGEDDGGCVKVSQLNLVDLAGSERAGQTGATGLRFKEGTHINKSLSALALVIKQLSEDPYKYANYRDSKLTRILQNSLGGNAKTSIICAITPAAVEETISTLQFANRAKAIKNKPEVNEVATNATMIQSLTRQLSRLKTQLETKKTIEQDNYNLQKQIANLQKLILNGFGQPINVDTANSRRKNDQLRRKTISTIHSIEEVPAPSVRQFCTPVLKYNPLTTIPGVSELAPTRLPTLPEEPSDRAVTPPPIHNRKDKNEIIVLDSDDESDTYMVCSPYHKCYGVTKTPPCILRRNARLAEKNLDDIIDFTDREKMYPPSTVELLEQLEKETAVIYKLKEEVELLNKQTKDKDFELELLKAKVKKADEELKAVLNAKVELEAKCKDYDTRMTDCEVSYETLKQKAKRREEELLSLLEDQVEKNKKEGAVLTQKLDKEINNFLDISKDISLVESDNESSVLVQTHQEKTLQLLISDLQMQISSKNGIITELEANLNAHKLRIDCFENSSQELQDMITNLKDKLKYVEEENSLFKSTIDTLNSTIKNQKENLEAANIDMVSYNSLIQELQIKLTNKDKLIGLNFNDSVLQSMVENEEKFLANNENMKNIVQCFKLTLDSRNKEIELLKSNLENYENTNHLEQLDSKIKEIDSLNEKLTKLDDQIKDNVIKINNLLQDKENWTSAEANLTQKITSLTKSNEELQVVTIEKDIYIEKLKEEVENLALKLSEKATAEIELLNANQKLSQQVKDISNTVLELENVIQEKNNFIIVIEEQNQKAQDNFDKIKMAVHKLQNILFLLKNDFQKVPENMNDFVSGISTIHSSMDMLETIVMDYMKQKDNLITNNKELLKELSKKESELLEKQMELAIVQKTMEELNAENKVISLQSQKLKFEVESKTNNICNLERELEELRENNEALKCDFSSKTDVPLKQDHNSSITSEKIESLEKEIDALNNLLKSKAVYFAQIILEKDTDLEKLRDNLEKVNKELSKKCVILESMTQQITNMNTQMNQNQNDRDQLLSNVVAKVNSMTKEFNIENNLSCQFIDGNVNTYEKIMLTLEKIKNHIEVIQNENCNADKKNIDDNLTEAKKVITELTKQNMELREKLCELENKSDKYLTDLEQIKTENNELNRNLISSQNILHQLTHEVAVKVAELDNMEVKAKGLEEEISKYDKQIKEQIQEMRIKNEKLKIDCKNMSPEIDSIELSDIEKSKKSNAMKYTTRLFSPPSLITISCNKIFESIQLKDSETKSVTDTISSTDIELDKIHKCQCEELSMNLNMVKSQCTELTKQLQQFETENKQLRKEQVEVRAELKLLAEPALQLQKKIANHKTNLSILTATTYAENKLLKSQVKVLQHHHSRFHNVCQRDIPAFKKQLQELLVMLKGNYAAHDTTIKRYSLPDVLENNTTLPNFKNDSTLDGDLLMLDSNITLTTTADNTLVGCNSTCLDLSQNLYNEVSCQTNNLNRTAEQSLVNMNSDSNLLLENLELLREENNHLRYQISKVSCSTNCTDKEIQVCLDDNTALKLRDRISEITQLCLNCEEYKRIQTDHNTHIDTINKELAIIKNDRNCIEQKYNILSSKLLLMDELESKINTLERDCNEKVHEITKLNKTVSSKNKELKDLQEENDVLSTQIMENVSEVDDLINKLKNSEQNNKELTEKCVKLEVELELVRKTNTDEVNCTQCISKGESTPRQRKSISERHTKLNRSYSDSDTSSRYNKICTLQNELHAGREDCIELTEDVTTIKNHLDRSNISMDLDITMGDPSVFTCNKDLANDLQQHTYNMPEIPEECPTDLYLSEKTDCFNYYVQCCGKTHENLNQNTKIIEVMKMLYNSLVTKHSNEVENLVNKLKDFNESKNQMQGQIVHLTKECSILKSKLSDKETCLKNANVLIQIKNNLNLLQTELCKGNNANICSKALEFFKGHVLELMDCEFETSTMSTFEFLINTLLGKHEKELNEMISKYSILQEQLQNIATELKTAKDNIAQLNVQLHDKEKEIIEIKNAFTMNISQKEREINNYILLSCRKIKEMNKIDIDNINLNNPIDKNLNLIFEQIRKAIDLKVKAEKEVVIQKLNEYDNILQSKEEELTDIKMQNEKLKNNNNTIALDLVDKEKNLKSLIDLHENLKQVYDSKVKENNSNLILIEKLSEEIESIKETIKVKEGDGDIAIARENQNEINKLLNTINQLNEEIKNLKTINEIIAKEKNTCKIELQNSLEIIQQSKIEFNKMNSDILVLRESVKESTEEIKNLKAINEIIDKEKNTCKTELQNSLEIIQQNKIEFNKMNSDILVLRESVKESTEVVDTLKSEAKSLLAQNLELKNQLDEKCAEYTRLQVNIKTHMKTAEIHTKIITRLKKQKEEDDEAINNKDKQIVKLTKMLDESKEECEKLQSSIKMTTNEIEQIKTIKESLEARVAELELANEKRRLSIDSIADASRRRRQSLHDSRRLFPEGGLEPEDRNNIEAVFESRLKQDDLFMDVDGDVSNRSTPIRLSKGRDSLHRSDQSDKEEEHSSRPSSVVAIRRRRQSTHDMQRNVINNEHMTRNTPSPCDYSSKRLMEKDSKCAEKDTNNEVSQLKEQLASCRAELEDLKEKYREVDEECEICAAYLRERDAQCLRLTKEKKELEKQLAEMKVTANPTSAGQQVGAKRSTANASVNTDEDWTNLHSLVVDRMSFDAEVEKNKKLTKVIEELRYKKQELQNGMARMQHAMKTHHDLSRDELEALKYELCGCKEELEQLKESYKELEDECEACSVILKERDAQCRKLKEAKDLLEAKLREYEDNESKITMSVRKKRQNVHDQNRNSSFEVQDASTETRDDLLSYQVERDDSSQRTTGEEHAKELKQMKLTIEKLAHQKATLEQQLMLARATPAQTMYVATGSAIVQNQQITDVMRENHKLKKINAKLMNICKKRGKSEVNRENEEFSEQG